MASSKSKATICFSVTNHWHRTKLVKQILPITIIDLINQYYSLSRFKFYLKRIKSPFFLDKETYKLCYILLPKLYWNLNYNNNNNKYK